MSKIITQKNYGSIPHLSTSKMGQQADKRIDLHSEKILTQKARSWKDLIIVTEKIDGSNVGVVKKAGEIIAITRKGHSAELSPYKQHHQFAKFVKLFPNLFSWLPEGWRICGEWCIQSHGTHYDILGYSPFLAFDIFDGKNTRCSFMTFYGICQSYKIPYVPILHIGQPVTLENAIKLMGKGHYGLGTPEGVVYRCEAEKKVDFLAKWVRPDKIDGEFMEDEMQNEGSYRWWAL